MLSRKEFIKLGGLFTGFLVFPRLPQQLSEKRIQEELPVINHLWETARYMPAKYSRVILNDYEYYAPMFYSRTFFHDPDPAFMKYQIGMSAIYSEKQKVHGQMMMEGMLHMDTDAMRHPEKFRLVVTRSYMNKSQVYTDEGRLPIVIRRMGAFVTADPDVHSYPAFTFEGS